MKLLREYYQLCPSGVCQDFLTESEKKDSKENGTLYLTGLIQHANKRNGNGRIYPKEILEREVEYYQQIINENRALGQLDHPDNSVVNLSEVSHIMEKVWWDGDGLYGKMRVLKHHPKGQIQEGQIRDGVQVGISSRGVGSIREEEDSIIVEDDFQLICFDIVQEPSTNQAFLMKECKQFDLQESRRVNSKRDRIYSKLINILG